MKAWFAAAGAMRARAREAATRTLVASVRARASRSSTADAARGPNRPSASLAAMMKRIDNSAPSAATRRAARSPYRATRWWGPLAVAASLAALSVALWTQLEMSKPDAAPQDGYRTLSAAPVHAAPRLQVVFYDEITSAALRETLDSVHAHIVSGPSAGGLFVIELDRVDGEAVSTSELNAALVQLREDPAVRFAAAAPAHTP